ncbi:MAG: ribosome-inactivating family protein [Alphaproteobacteria bacterium]|jgi:hypothetical protein|nr:ribosome-inactivating family protein [Alphaproteobacteria bacterium]
MGKLKFFVILVVSLWSVNSFANACRVVDSHIITLDSNYNQNMMLLTNIVSTESPTQDNLRQTLPMNTNPCIAVDIKNTAGDSLRIIITHDLLFQGFITKSNQYYFFSNADIKAVDGTETNTNLRFSNRNNALGTKGLELSANNINTAITNLSNFDGNSTRALKQDMARVRFISVESLKFHSVNDMVITLLHNQNQTIRWDNYNTSINNWARLSNKARNNGVILAENAQDSIGTKNDIRVARSR